MINNRAVERAYLANKQNEFVTKYQIQDQKTADRRIYWYVLALAVAFLLRVALPLPWATWVSAWL